ncbi:MAG: ATP-binding protein, partial [Desulfobacterales bacterium]|nr:ATP-binding protein [Desulfobacterales bacterium]
LFYGREEILKAIMTRVGGRVLQSISIVGERRMGKSSLLNHVKNTFRERLPKENNYLIIYLDLMKGYCRTRKGLMRALRRRLAKMWREPWPEDEDGDIGAFDFAIEDLRDDDIRLILCLDEVENLTKRPAEFDDVLEDWRACGSMGQMAMITASSHPLADLCKAGGLSSPFFNIFSQSYLGLLEPDEWKALVTNHMKASKEELRLIEDAAGGQPFFTQIAA